MTTARRRLPVRFDEAVWLEAVRASRERRYRSPRARGQPPRARGLALAHVRPCDAQGPDGTRLAGCAKLYLPASEGPPSARPFAFVMQLARESDAGLVWVLVAFGHRHPAPGVRSVYERAHRQLHGHFP